MGNGNVGECENYPKVLCFEMGNGGYGAGQLGGFVWKLRKNKSN